MSRLLAFALAALSIASVAPVLAAPIHITVPGGSRDSARDRAQFVDPRDIYWNDPWQDQQPGERFDPGLAAREALWGVPWGHPHHESFTRAPGLAEALARTGDSLATHWLKCQARYASYSLVDNTYSDGNGLPRPCRL